MLTDYFLKLGTKGNKDYYDNNVRERVGYIAGTVGIFINLFLSVLKLVVGVAMSSIAVTADAFNNLSDTASSIMTVVGFKLSNSPPDEKHPHGHGRVEYLTALMIAVMVMVVGIQFIKSSIERILNPKPVEFQIISFILLVLSISLKMWLSIFNKKLGNKISSAPLKAASADALGDVIITSVVASSLLLSLITTYPIDGYVGVLVSIFILYSGFSLVRDTLSQLIGEAPPKDLTEQLIESLLSYEYILDVHDLIVHNYGPGKVMATIDAEIPYDIDVVTIHDIIDKAERELSERFNIHLVIHMDPVGFLSKEVYEVKTKIKNKLKDNVIVKSIHDFNMIKSEEGCSIIFHVVIDGNAIDKGFCEEEFKSKLEIMIKDMNDNWSSDIIIDIEY